MNDVSPGGYEDRKRRVRRTLRRNIVWIIPAALVVGTGLFFGLGNLVVWLWRVTVVDLFGFKPISFWQAWGLILLSQILFKANVSPTVRTGRWRRRHDCSDEGSPEMNPKGERI